MITKKNSCGSRIPHSRFQCCQSLVGCFILYPETSASKKYHQWKKRWPNWREKINEAMGLRRVNRSHFSVQLLDRLPSVSDTQENESQWKVAIIIWSGIHYLAIFVTQGLKCWKEYSCTASVYEKNIAHRRGLQGPLTAFNRMTTLGKCWWCLIMRKLSECFPKDPPKIVAPKACIYFPGSL